MVPRSSAQRRRAARAGPLHGIRRRLLRLPLDAQSGAEIGVRSDIVRLEPDRFAIFVDGRLQLSLASQGVAQAHVGGGEVGLETDCRAEGGFRAR